MPRYNHQFTPFGSWLKFSMPFGDRYKDAVRTIPGVHWSPDAKAWLCPAELPLVVAKALTEVGYHIPYPDDPVPPINVDRYKTAANGDYPFQLAARDLAHNNKAALFALEQGLGKCRSALRIIADRSPSLVVAPANVKDDWRQQAAALYPNLKVQIFNSGKDYATIDYSADVHVTSYGLLEHHLAFDNFYRTIVLDEGHRLSGYDCRNVQKAGKWQKVEKGSKQSLACFRLRELHPEAWRLVLTGTPIGNRIDDLWPILEWLYPKRVGTFYQWRTRYAKLEPSKYQKIDDDGESRPAGFKITGINPVYADELSARLKHLAIRATKSEWAHLLPPLTLQPMYRRLDGVTDIPAQKAVWAVEVAKELLETVPKLAVVTHHRHVAEAIADQTGVYAITGDMPIQPRLRALQRIADEDPLLVASGGAIQEGVNMLTPFYNVLLAELNEWPLATSQIIARFHRLTSQFPVTVRVLVLQGTDDETRFAELQGKINDMNRIIAAGATERAFEDAVRDVDMSGALEGAILE